MAKLDQLFAAYPSSVRIQGTTEADVTCVNSEYNQELITLFIRKYSLGSTYFAHKLPQLEKSYLNIRKIQNESYALQQTLIGRELVKVGQLNEAFEKYQSALELDSDCIAAIISRGELFLMKNKAAKALADFSKALEMDPLNKEAKKHLSIAMESVKAEGARQQSLKSGEFLLVS